MNDLIKKYKKPILAVLGALASLAILTATGLDDQIIKSLTEFVESISVEETQISPTIVIE